MTSATQEPSMHKPNYLKKWLLDDRGVTSIEYALLGSLIAAVIIGSVSAVGHNVRTLYQMIATAVP